jgi:hypothetical protein
MEPILFFGFASRTSSTTRKGEVTLYTYTRPPRVMVCEACNLIVTTFRPDALYCSFQCKLVAEKRKAARGKVTYLKPWINARRRIQRSA